MVKHLIEATLRSRKIKRKRYADGGGDLSDADQAAMMPETYVNPVAKGLVSGIGHMAMIPQRAIENSQNSLDTGNYDPGPTLEAATLPMGAGAIAGVPMGAGEGVLGAGAIRFLDKPSARIELNRSTRVIEKYNAKNEAYADGKGEKISPEERADWLGAFQKKQAAQQYLDSTQPIELGDPDHGELPGAAALANALRTPAKAGGGALSFDDLPNAAPSTGGISFDDLPSAGPSVGADVAKSAGVGAGKGLLDFAGSVGDLTDLGAKGIEKASNFVNDTLGLPRYERPSTPSVLNNIPTSGSLQKQVEGVTGPFYQPQTTAGKFAGAITESAANPLSYVGPGGMAGKVAGAVATGAGSEGAGELAQKYAPEAEPYARIAGGLLGGAAAGTASAAVENTMRARGIPTTQELRQAADTAYGNARALNVEYSPGQLAILRDQIRRDLIKQGHRADKSGGTFSRIDELPDPPTPAFPNGNRNFSDIEGVRQSLRDITGEVDARGMRTADARAADRAIDRIDDFLEDPSKAVAGHQGLAAQQAQFAREGRENWGAMARSQQVEAALARGQRNADASGTGSNVDNTLRQQVKQILNNPRRAKNFTNDDRQIMEDIVAGNPIRNSARLVGKLAATGIVSATGVVALGHMMGLGAAGVGALPAIGEGARRLGIAMTRNRYGRLLENIRMDSAAGRANPVGPRASASPSVIRSALTTPRLYVSPGSNPYAP